MFKIVAIIPARGGSKSIPRKNVKLLKGKPLIYYTINEALRSKYLSKIIVSTEDKEISEISRGYGATVVMRPPELAQDDTPSLPVFQHVIQHLEAENFRPNIVVILQATSPLRKVQDIDEAIQKLLDISCDSVVSVCQAEHPPHWMFILEGDRLKPVIDGYHKITQRQNAPEIYRLNGAVYVTWRDIIMKQNRLIGNDTRAYIMPPERSIDIDADLDFKLAELLMP